MFHGSATPSGNDPASPYKARIGVWMFFLYAAIYAGFVAINLARPLLMEKEIFLGLNVAIVYGFGLIVLALVMALIYNALCGKREAAMASKSVNGKEARS